MRIEKINLYMVYYFTIKMCMCIHLLLTVVYIDMKFVVFLGNNRQEMFDRFNQWQNPKQEDDDDDDDEEEEGKVVLNLKCCIDVFVVVFL